MKRGIQAISRNTYWCFYWGRLVVGYTAHTLHGYQIKGVPDVDSQKWIINFI
jgi:hypothetical protein